MTMTMTLAMAEERTGISVLDYLDRQAKVPILTTAQRQGDVMVIPLSSQSAPGERITDAVPVVRGENGGNTHALVADGVCTWAPSSAVTATLPDLGVLEVEEGATAYLAHPEHGFLGIGPGRYVVRRQVEQSEVARLVAD